MLKADFQNVSYDDTATEDQSVFNLGFDLVINNDISENTGKD